MQDFKKRENKSNCRKFVVDKSRNLSLSLEFSKLHFLGLFSFDLAKNGQENPIQFKENPVPFCHHNDNILLCG